MMAETEPDYTQVVSDTTWYISMEEEATKKVSEKTHISDSIMSIIKALHEKQWVIYTARGVMNKCIKKNNIMKARMTARLRSNEGIDEKVLQDKLENDKDTKEQAQVIEKAVNELQMFKKEIIECLDEPTKKLMKEVRQEIKKEYQAIQNEQIEKMNNEEAHEHVDAKENDRIISEDDAATEDAQAWVDQEPMRKNMKA